MRFEFRALFTMLCFAAMVVVPAVAQAPSKAKVRSSDYHLTLVSTAQQYNDGPTSITCSSDDGRRKYCGKYEGNLVSLNKQISGSRCVQGRTWGVDGNGLWVDRGCRAIFTVYASSPGGSPGGGWWKPDPGDRWPPADNWHGGNWSSGGACFYTGSDFSGNFFCMRRGEQNESLTGGFGDQVSSIRIFGRARVFLYDDRDFRGPRLMLKNDAPDLKRFSVQGKPGHSWNNRINSVRIQ